MDTRTLLIGDPEYQEAARFSPDERDGFRCVWAQRLRSDMHPEGKPFPVYHSHERKRPVEGELGVGPHAIVFTRDELAGNVWLLEPAKAAAK